MSRWSARSSGLLSANTTGLVTECRPSSSRYDGERTASRANERGIAARTTGATARAARKRTRWQSPTKPVWFPGGLDGQSRPNVRRLPIAEAELIRAFRGGGARLRTGGFAVRRRRPGFRPRPGHDAGSCSPRSLRRSLDRTGQFGVRQFGVSSSLLLPLHQVGKLDSWEDFQDRQAMTLFTTRSTAGTTEPMSSAPTANGICSLAISPAPRHGTLSRSSATA